MAHINHSILLFCPTTSLFRHQYEHHLEGEVNLIVGVNTYWPMLRQYIRWNNELPGLMEFSPDSRMLCVAASKSNQERSDEASVSYKIYSTRTRGEIVEFHEFTPTSYRSNRTVTWSPDSRIIATTSRGVISLRNCRTTKEGVKQTPQMSVLHFCS